LLRLSLQFSWSKIVDPPPVPEQQQQAERGAALLLQVPDDCRVPRLLQPSEDGQALLCQAPRQAEEDCANGELSFFVDVIHKGFLIIFLFVYLLELDNEPPHAAFAKKCEIACGI